MPQITNHAKRRMKERCGIGKGSVQKMAKRAYQKGLKHSETTGDLNKYISREFFKYKKANNIRIYAEKVWIFINDKLITVYKLPEEFIQETNKQKRERNLLLKKSSEKICEE